MGSHKGARKRFWTTRRILIVAPIALIALFVLGITYGDAWNTVSIMGASASFLRSAGSALVDFFVDGEMKLYLLPALIVLCLWKADAIKNGIKHVFAFLKNKMFTRRVGIGIGIGVLALSFTAGASYGMNEANKLQEPISAAWNGSNPEVVSATRPDTMPSIPAPPPTSAGVENKIDSVPQPQQPAPTTSEVSEPATVPVPDSAVQQPVTPDQLSQPTPKPSGIKHWLGEQSDSFMHNATVVRDFGVGLAHDAKRLCDEYCPVIKDHSIQFFNWSLDNVFTVLAVLLLLFLLFVIRRITRNRRLARKYARHLRKQKRMKNAFDEREARWKSRFREDDEDSNES